MGFLGGILRNSSSGTGQEGRAPSAKIPPWNLLGFASEGISFCAPGGWQLALSPRHGGVTGVALQGSLGGLYLVRVAEGGAAVTGVPNAVPVPVPLVRVGHSPAVVHGVLDAWKRGER